MLSAMSNKGQEGMFCINERGKDPGPACRYLITSGRANQSFHIPYQ